MSLLEDVFLENEADEAQELERVIEGDEFDERPRSRSRSPDNSDENEPKDDEAEEDKRRVDPSSTKTKRVTKNPRFILNPARLTGPRGIQILPDHFKDFKFKGRGHEKDDLDMVLKKLEHWAYRLYPKFQFEDCLKKMESLGKKRPVMVHLQKIRTDQFISGETVVQKDSSDEETQPPQEQDEFDKLLQQQIDLARATPAPESVKKVMGTPKKDRSPFTMPKATSSPSISDDQKERMIRNRKLAEERRLARLKQNSIDTSGKQDSVIIEVDEEVETHVTAKKQHKSFVINSSDDECDVTSVNQSVTVDIHNGTKKGEESNDKVVLDTAENLHDIEMEDNIDKNNTQEVNQDVVEIIDDADKGVGRNVRLNEDTAEAVEIIEINDQTGKIIETNKMVDGIDDADKDIGRNVRVTEHTTEAVEIIEINDDQTGKIIETNKVRDGVIEIDDESNHGATEILDKVIDDVIEINDLVTTDIVKETSISNATEVIKENDNTSSVNVNTSNRALTSEVVINDNNSIEDESKSPSDSDSIQNENIEQNEIGEIQDADAKNVNNSDKNANMAEEVIEDMDVDFSDDF